MLVLQVLLRVWAAGMRAANGLLQVPQSTRALNALPLMESSTSIMPTGTVSLDLLLTVYKRARHPNEIFKMLRRHLTTPRGDTFSAELSRLSIEVEGTRHKTPAGREGRGTRSRKQRNYQPIRQDSSHNHSTPWSRCPVHSSLLSIPLSCTVEAHTISLPSTDDTLHAALQVPEVFAVLTWRPQISSCW